MKCFSINPGVCLFKEHKQYRPQGIFFTGVGHVPVIPNPGWDGGNTQKQLPVSSDSLLANSCFQKEHLLWASSRTALSNIIPYHTTLLVMLKKKISKGLNYFFHLLFNSHIRDCSIWKLWKYLHTSMHTHACTHTYAHPYSNRNFQSHVRWELLLSE